MSEERGLLLLTGPQRIWFLQQTVTADVEDLPDGRWRESAFLTSKGKLISHFRVGVLGEQVWLDVDPPAAALSEWLIRYRFRTKVDIEDRSGAVTTVLGPPAAELAGDGETGESGGSGGSGVALIFGAAFGDTPVAYVHGDAPAGTPAADPAAVELARVEAGVARFGVDYTTSHLPQEAGLTRVVPVDKGCYVGQETVARIHFRGHVNRCVRPLRFDSAVAVGSKLLLDGAPIGEVTSAVISPRLGPVGIGMVRVEPAEGAVAEVEGGGVATLGPLPEGTKVKTG